MFTVMKECDNTLPNMKKVQSPALRSYPTPLWYLFDSELDILIWRDCGCPSIGVLSTIKKNTRNCYKYEIWLKRQAEHIKSEKLAEACCNAHNTDFWYLVRKQRGNSKSSCNVIDGLTTDDSISNMFSKICSILDSDSDHFAREFPWESHWLRLKWCPPEFWNLIYFCDQFTRSTQ